MKLSYRWLQSLLPGLDQSPREVADRLSMLGAAVDALTDLASPLAEVQVARVLEVRPHPAADRLRLCTVDAGNGALQVVCGASNVAVDHFYPFIPAGGTLPGGIRIRRSRIRGEESLGMLCSPRELALGRDHEGLYELAGEFAPGARFVDAVGLDDACIEIDVTPNRPDLLSHYGVARELAAHGSRDLRLPAFPGGADAAATWNTVLGGGPTEADGFPVGITDLEGCPRYLGLVLRGVSVGPSPDWLATRLRAIGQRPINNVVDATNYILHELGQPLHAFDLDTLQGGIDVRRAAAGERIVTLDGEKRALTPDVLVIADGEGPVALAGIMGGERTEVGSGTRNIFLECALFEPRTIRKGRRLLGLSTDASQRFERGVDPDGMERAAVRAAALILAVAGGRLAAAGASVGTERGPLPVVKLRPSRAEQVLGVPFEPEVIAQHLRGLDFEVAVGADGVLAVTVPGHRIYDVGREDDLVEELARRHGYDAFPDTLRSFRPSVVPTDPVMRVQDRLRDRLVGRGLLEARSAAFAPEGEGDVELLHPLSAEESRLRRTLVHGLLHRLEGNFSRGTRDVRLFETGTVFGPPDADRPPAEHTHLAVVLTGLRQPPHWSGSGQDLDVWDLRGVLETVAESVGGSVVPAQDVAAALDGHLASVLDAARSYAIERNGETVGVGGAVLAGRVDAPAWAAPVWALEARLTADMAALPTQVFEPLPAFPFVERDIALLVPEALAAASLEETIRASAGGLLEELWPFDVYTGQGIEPGQRSVAFRMRFRAQDRTLKDEEVDEVVGRVLERLRKEHHVERRG